MSGLRGVSDSRVKLPRCTACGSRLTVTCGQGAPVHELAITQSVVDAVLDRTGQRPVTAVRVKIGRLAGVVPEAMRFCFDLVTAGTPLEGARLDIDQPPGA